MSDKTTQMFLIRLNFKQLLFSFREQYSSRRYANCFSDFLPRSSVSTVRRCLHCKCVFQFIIFCSAFKVSVWAGKLGVLVWLTKCDANHFCCLMWSGSLFSMQSSITQVLRVGCCNCKSTHLLSRIKFAY